MPENPTAAEVAMMRERISNTVERLEAVAAEMKADRAEFHTAVADLRDEIARYKGFMGGIAFIFSCLLAAAGLAKGWLFGGDK